LKTMPKRSVPQGMGGKLSAWAKIDFPSGKTIRCPIRCPKNYVPSGVMLILDS